MREDTIRKIQKLLALSNSPNENEAALAMAKAQELLDRENLSMSEIKEADSVDIQSSQVYSKGRYPYWEGFLFSRLAKKLDCFPFQERSHRKISLWLTGYKQDVSAFICFHDFLKKAISILCDECIVHESSRSKNWNRKMSFQFRNSFCVGATVRVCEKIDKMRQARLSQDVVCKAVIVSKKKAVQTWVSENLRLKKQNKSSSMSQQDFNKGYVAGASISIQKEISVYA